VKVVVDNYKNQILFFVKSDFFFIIKYIKNINIKNMLNKILIFWGLALSSILIIENLVMWQQAYVLISNNSTAWFLSMFSTLVGVWIWFWLKGFMINWNEPEDDSLDF